MRRAGGWMLQTVLACGCSVDVAREPTDVHAASASGSGGADAGGTDAAPDAGPEWTHDPGQTYSNVSCQENGMLLFVEIWPKGDACVPDPSITDVLVLGIEEWDGAPGTYTVDEPTPHGTARAGLSTLGGETEGTITLEPFEETPRWISWELAIAEGRTDLGLCGHFENYPCPPAP